MWFLKPNVEKLRTRQDVGGLARAAVHEDREVARQAAEAIVDIGAPAVGALTRVLQSLGPIRADSTAWSGSDTKDWRLAKQQRLLDLLCRVDAPAAVIALPSSGEAVVHMCLLGHAKALAGPLAEARAALLASAIDASVARVFREWKSALVRIGRDRALAALGDEEATTAHFTRIIDDLCATDSGIGALLPCLFSKSLGEGVPTDLLRVRILRPIAGAKPEAVLRGVERLTFDAFSPWHDEVASVLGQVGGLIATDGVLAIGLRHPMGASWADRHRRCIKAIQDKGRAVSLVLERLRSIVSYSREEPVPQALYCLGRLLDLPWAEWIRWSDFDVGDPENQSFRPVLESDLNRQEQLQRQVFDRVHDALNRKAIPIDGDLASVRAAIEAVLP